MCLKKFYFLFGENTNTLSVTWTATPLFIYFLSIYDILLLYNLKSYNKTYHIELHINPQLEMMKSKILIESPLSLVNSVCPSCLTHNIPMLEFLRIFLEF